MLSASLRASRICFIDGLMVALQLIPQGFNHCHVIDVPQMKHSGNTRRKKVKETEKVQTSGEDYEKQITGIK